MIELRDYQRKALDELYSWFSTNEGNPCVEAPTGCHARGTGILMANGDIKKVEDIVIGDRVMGGDGTPRTVMSLHRGQDEMFRIVPIKGNSFVVNGGHILSLIATPEGNRYPGNFKGTETCNISVYDYLKKTNNFKHLHKLYKGKVSSFEGESSDLKIPPYVLGLILGDGNMTHNNLEYTNPDVETYKDLYKWADSIGCMLKMTFNSSGCPTLKFRGKERFWRNQSVYGNILKEYGLKGCTSENKFIPKEYKTASMGNRLEILAGLLDTDGSLSRNNYDYISKSKQLATDVWFVANSVGLRALMSECTKSCQTGYSGTYYRVSISGDTSIIPCRISRKKASKRLQKKRVSVTGFSIEPVGRGDYYGFECDGDHLYMLEDFTVTHNSGKSVLLAKFCEENIQANPNVRIVIVTHVKELVQQDHDAVLKAWPEAPISIYSAGIGIKETNQITCCGIQSIYKHPELLGHVDVVLVDEAHLIPVEGTGMYLSFIEALKQVNPNLTVIGFTATPYRLKHGMITDEPAIFKGPIVETIGIRELQDRGYLAMLRSKSTKEKLSTKGVKIQGGDFVEKDLQRVINQDGTSRSVVKETLSKIEGRNHVLFFCCGIEHAERMRDLLIEAGETAETVSAKTPKKERDDIIARFKNGEIRFLTNTSVLTTGFDYPDIDCIVMMRPTLSPGLYCLSMDTEILTTNGWKRYDEMKGSDMALSFDYKTEEIRESEIKGIIRRNLYEGENWVTFKNAHSDFKVTENHRMIFKARRYEYQIKEAKEVLGYTGGINLPVAGNMETPGIPLSDDEIRFIGWVMTDGTINKKNRAICISQKTGSKYESEIEDCIKSCGMKYGKHFIVGSTNFTEHRSQTYFTVSYGKPRGRDKDKRGWAYLEKYISKDVSPELFKMSRHQFEVLLETSDHADGRKMDLAKLDYTPKTVSIVKGNKTFIDRMQALGVLHGYRSNYSVYTNDRKNPIYCLRFRDVPFIAIGGSYDGRPFMKFEKGSTEEECWCIETEMGTIITRRNGKVLIVGNCQEAGRGLRLKSNGGDCLVLDYAGNVARHGPVTDVQPPCRHRKRDSVAPSKLCPVCDEIVAVQSRVCPSCGYEWPVKEASEDFHLHDDDISGRDKPHIDVGFWWWTKCKSRAGEDMVRVTYRASMLAKFEVNEYFLLWRNDYVGTKAQKQFLFIIGASGLDPYEYPTIEQMLEALNKKGTKPTRIDYKLNGKWPSVLRRIWE